MRRVILSILALALSLCSAKAQLLYKISGNGLSKPSYIIGTFHVAPASIVDDIPGAHEALNAVEQVCGEIDLIAETSPEYEMRVNERRVLPFSLRIDDVLSESEMERLNGYMLRMLGYDFTDEQVYASMCMLRPSELSALFTNMLYAEMVPNYDANSSMDSYFQQEALRMGKGCTALESVDFQVELLYAPVPFDKERDELFAFIDYPELCEFGIRMITEAYYSQNLRQLSRALRIFDTEQDDFDEVLIVERNNNWIKLMPKMMAEKSTLFVVGSAHLPEKHGMIKLLRRAGYKVTPIKNKKQVS